MKELSQTSQNATIREFAYEFIISDSENKQKLTEIYSDIDKNSEAYFISELGEQLAYDIQTDIICEYLNTDLLLKEDIFQRGLARTKAYLTTPLGKGFFSAKNQQVAQNLINTFKKNTERVVIAGPSPFTPTSDDQKNSSVNIGKIGALIGQRFANMAKNPKLSAPPTSNEIQSGLGRIQKIIDKLKSTGLVKGADNVIDEIGIFARQHPYLTNTIVAGLTSALTIATAPGWLASTPIVKKFLVGATIRTVLGMAKGESPQQAAAKGAAISGAGVAVGKLLGMASEKLSTWLGSQIPQTSISTQISPSVAVEPVAADTVVADIAAEPVVEPVAVEPVVTEPEPVATDTAVADIAAEPVVEPVAAEPVVAEPATPILGINDVKPQISALNRLTDWSSYKGGEHLTGGPRKAIMNWLNTVQTSQQAQALLGDRNVANQMMRKGVTGILKKKFNLQETKEQSEIDLIKAELKSDVNSSIIIEANPLTAAKNFMFGGPEVGGKNARIDYKQVESDYLKLLNNLEGQFGVNTEIGILDMLKKNNNVYPGAYDYVMKVRNWLYGSLPTVNKPSPEPVMVPPSEVPSVSSTVAASSATVDQPITDKIQSQQSLNNLDVNKIKNVKVFLSRMIDLGDLLSRTNPSELTKPILRDLAKNIYTIGDVMVNKKIDGKVNNIVDKATSGLDILGQQQDVKPVSSVAPNVFKEVDEASSLKPLVYINRELSDKISLLKNHAVFKNLPQRLGVLMKAKYNDARSLLALKTFLNVVYNSISKNSSLFQKEVGNPVTIKKELESNKEYLKEVTAAEIQGFSGELNSALIEIIKIAGKLRQIFNKNNPDSIYNVKNSNNKNKDIAGFKPKDKLAIYTTMEDKPLMPKSVYQFIDDKWNIVQKSGPSLIKYPNHIEKLNQLAKAGRDDLDKIIKLTHTKKGDKSSGISYDVAQQIKEMYGVVDYKKFFI